MAVKRALVVDDSKAARVSLKKLLSEYELEISLAASGEEALELLKRESVDVIFMDHTMPGMDGLEAVSAIKANPRTATIPVMMYTTREGEVYVGQARALGAVGVLPKNVEPHELFEMLRKLGLVQERRLVPREAPAAAATPTADALPGGGNGEGAIDRILEDQAQGIALQSVVRRILEDQHITLRSDVLRSQRAFAKDVAREVLKEYQAMEGAFVDDANADRGRGAGLSTWAMGLAVTAIVISSFFAFQFKNQRDAAMDALARYSEQSSTAQNKSMSDREIPLEPASEPQFVQINEQTLTLLQSSLNRDNNTGLFGAAFNAELASKIETVVPRLEKLGFQGEIRLTSHLGRFCLTVSDNGSYELAPADMPVAQCAHVGHVLDLSNYVDDRMDPDFALALSRLNESNLKVTPVALYIDDSVESMDYPGAGVSAAEWNAIAKINNRVVVELIPTS
ncbi:MAG: response regulator [Pseudomonadota bacterium]